MNLTLSPNASPAEQLAALSKEDREGFLAKLTEDETLALLKDWRGFWARKNQIAPDGSWSTWLVLAGRGFQVGDAERLPILRR